MSLVEVGFFLDLESVLENYFGGLAAAGFGFSEIAPT